MTQNVLIAMLAVVNYNIKHLGKVSPVLFDHQLWDSLLFLGLFFLESDGVYENPDCHIKLYGMVLFLEEDKAFSDY